MLVSALGDQCQESWKEGMGLGLPGSRCWQSSPQPSSVPQRSTKVNVLADRSSETLPSAGDKSDQRKTQLMKRSLHIRHARVLHLAVAGVEKPTDVAASWGVNSFRETVLWPPSQGGVRMPRSATGVLREQEGVVSCGPSSLKVL